MRRVDLEAPPLDSAVAKIYAYSGLIPLEQARTDACNLLKARIAECKRYETGAPPEVRQVLRNDRFHYQRILRAAKRGDYRSLTRQMEEEASEFFASIDTFDPMRESIQEASARRLLVNSLTQTPPLGRGN